MVRFVIHGVFQRNGPAAIQHIAENLQKMLGAGAEDDLLGPAAHPAGLCQVLRDAFPQRNQPLGRGVLQKRGVRLIKTGAQQTTPGGIREMARIDAAG